MIPNIMSASVQQAAVQRKFRTQYCKMESGYKFVCCYVCTEGLVSLRKSSGWVADTLSLWPHLNSNPSQTADHKHTSTKALHFRYTQCAALGGGDLLTEVTLVNTQNVSVTKMVDSTSIQCAETKYDLRIQFLALVVMIQEVWVNA